ncbi:MAG: DNA cytosine methyltransferase [Aurantimonas endophytica]|uniref:DNA cytosine methyltransferase n=1 Tax=Aurantimonas endophytica TaxID=1522175 RepID=UPI003002965E
MSSTYGVIDLFAGPGGLGEGFAGFSTKDRRPFQIVISAEMEAAAHSTLRLRAFVRAHLAKEGCLPDGYEDFHRGGATATLWQDHPLWSEAEHEARRLTLGSPEAREPIAAAISEARSRFGENTVVIGGPPCQAYSLAGRARNRGIEGYKAEEDGRHFLFREYIAVLRALHPAVFVMENVTGMLSSAVGGRRVFEMVLEDLRSLGGKEGSLYELVALSPRSLLRTAPQDFVVYAEDHGVPQRRHRVIVVGVRKDVAEAWRVRRTDGGHALLAERPKATVRQVIGGFPELRSGLSREQDDFRSWAAILELTATFLAELPDVADVPEDAAAALRRLPRQARAGAALPRSSTAAVRESAETADSLIRFLTAASFNHTAQHGRARMSGQTSPDTCSPRP